MAAVLEQHQAWLALVIVFAVFVLFLMERYPPAVIAICGAAAFLLLGLIDTDDVLAIFSNSAPVTIAAMFILSGALVRTGTLEAAAAWASNRAQRHPVSTLILFGLGAAGASAFVNNTPVVVVLMPIVIRLAKTLGLAATQLLIPLSYVAILGGTCTLIGTSTNLVVDGLARQHGVPAFSIFEITPIGLIVASVGLLAMAVLAPRLLPRRVRTSDLVDEREAARFLTEVAIAQGAPSIGKAIGAVKALNRAGVEVVAVRRGGRYLRNGLAGEVLQNGDSIVLMATMAELLALHADPAYAIVGGQAVPGPTVIVEAVLAPGHGQRLPTLKEMGLERFGARLLGVNRHRYIPGPDLENVRLRSADRLLLEGTPQALATAAEALNLINVTTPHSRSFRRNKAPIAIAAMAAVVILAAFDVMPIVGLALLAVAAIFLFRCIDADEAWQSMDVGTLTLIFAMLAVGTGLEKTGAIDILVAFAKPYLSGSSPLVALFAVYFISMLLTELVTNNAVAVLMTPIAIGLGDSLGIDARPLIVAVMFGASASFATPVGYQTNTMVYAVGDYRFADFLRIGVPMNLIVGLATCTAIAVIM